MATKGVNKVILLGNLGQEPVVRGNDYSQVTSISLATSESWKDKETGEKKEQTEWHKIVFFGKLAEIAGKYLKKGSKVYIEGALKTRKWADKQGVERYTTEIIASSLQMLDKMGDSKPASDTNSKSYAKASGGSYGQSDFDDDVPF